MSLSEETKSYLRSEAINAFKVIDTCLKSYYSGDHHMYKPIAGQLRLLLCDTTKRKDNSLITKIFRDFSIGSLLPICEFNFGEAPRGYEWANSYNIDAPKDHEYKIVAMPFSITKYANDLEVADLVFSGKTGTMPFSEWLDQEILIDPVKLTIREAIRTVADKGGGSHLDTNQGDILPSLRTFGPGKTGFEKLVIIAIARFFQTVGIYYQQHGERNNFKGEISKIVNDFDNEDPIYKNRAQVDKYLLDQDRHEYYYNLIKRIK